MQKVQNEWAHAIEKKKKEFESKTGDYIDLGAEQVNLS